MRIGIDARFYHPEAAGLARYASELVPRLLALKEAQKHHFVIFLPTSVDLPKHHHPHVEMVQTDIKHYGLAEQITFYRMLNRQHLDLVHFLHFNHPLLYQRPSIFTIHDLILSSYPGRQTSPLKLLSYELTIRHALRRATALIAVSTATKRQMIDHYHTDPHKINVVYEAVDKRYKKIDNQKLLAGVRSRYHLKKPFILYVGQWREHKNLPRLLEAFASVHARNRSVQLVLAGKADPHYPEVYATIARHHLSNAVVIPGFIPEDDLPLLYNAAEMAVTPSLMEGFGLPPLEAMACHCPLACSNASSLPEIAGDGALYFDPLSVVDMADKISLLLEDKSLRSIVVKAGASRVAQFSWDTMAEQVLAIYLSCTVQ